MPEMMLIEFEHASGPFLLKMRLINMGLFEVNMRLSEVNTRLSKFETVLTTMRNDFGHDQFTAVFEPRYKR